MFIPTHRNQVRLSPDDRKVISRWQVCVLTFYAAALLVVGVVLGVTRNASHSVEVTAASPSLGVHAIPVSTRP